MRMGLPVSTYCERGVKDGALLGGWWIAPPEALGTLAARILRGEKAGDLPWEQPREFRLGINLKTAKGLGISIPPAILVQATQVFE